MEKEQKKLLLVAVSVGVFLLVTITAAIVVLTPKVNVEEPSYSFSHPYPAGRIQPAIVSNGNNQQQPEPIQETIVSEDIEDTETVAEVIDVNNGDRLTINIPRPTTAAVPDTPVQSTRPVATVTPSRPEPAPAPAARPAPAPAARPAPAPAPAARPTPAPAARPAPTRVTNDYWVQTGAFTAKVRAEDAKDLLASKGITSIIENRQIDGRLWYRVRLGTYTSENEANYWLALVKSIDGFGESQIRQSVRQQ